MKIFGYDINPMKPVQSDIAYFKTHHSDQIKSYQSDDLIMSYAEAGNPKNRPVIFVHGSPGVKDSWYSFLVDKQLVEKFHLIAVDRPGYGKSRNGFTERSLEKQATDIWNVLRTNESDLKPILVGHSFGGAVIAKIAMLHSDRIHGLMFVASSVDPEQEKVKFIQRLASLPVIKGIIPNNLRVCNEEILALKSELIKILPEWPKIKIKSIVIHGDKDDLVPIANLSFLRLNLTIDKTYILEGMNHFIPWHRPEVIKTALIELETL